MKISKIAALMASVAIAASALTSCGGSKPNYSSPDPAATAIIAPTDPLAKPDEPVEAASDGPRLWIEDTTAAPGEYAKITVMVENAYRTWSMCGFHVAYPNILKPQMFDEEKRLVEKDIGEASKYNVGSVCMEWRENLDKYLIDNDLGCTFFCETFEDNYGLDGDIFSMYLKIPDDAVSGTEYPVEFFYIDGDIFQNTDKDESMQKYVFANWKGGKITVS